MLACLCKILHSSAECKSLHLGVSREEEAKDLKQIVNLSHTLPEI